MASKTIHTGAATISTLALTLVLGPINVANCTRWSATLYNSAAVGNTLSGALEISNDPTSTAASVTDWFNINADVATGLVPVFDAAQDPLTVKAFFGTGTYPCRWLRVRGAAGIGDTVLAKAKVLCTRSDTP